MNPCSQRKITTIWNILPFFFCTFFRHIFISVLHYLIIHNNFKLGMQYVECNSQHATCNMQYHATCNIMQLATKISPNVFEIVDTVSHVNVTSTKNILRWCQLYNNNSMFCGFEDGAGF